MSLVGKAQEAPATRGAMGLVGQVSKVTEQEALDAFDEPFRITITRFSRDGHILEVSCPQNTYQCQARILEWQGDFEISEQQDRDFFVHMISFERDQNGELREKGISDTWKKVDSQSVSEIHYRHSASGDETSTVENGVVIKKTVRTALDREGAVQIDSTRCRWVTPDVCRLDDHSTSIETTRHLPDGSTSVTTEQGTYKNVKIQDANGSLLEERTESPGHFGRITHKYNASGWETERSEWRRCGHRINWTLSAYEVDSHGNWIKQTEYFNSNAMEDEVPGNVTTRKIEYYD
jgi:hypothetical protein